MYFLHVIFQFKTENSSLEFVLMVFRMAKFVSVNCGAKPVLVNVDCSVQERITTVTQNNVIYGGVRVSNGRRLYTTPCGIWKK